jgi:hypothetical protein
MGDKKLALLLMLISLLVVFSPLSKVSARLNLIAIVSNSADWPTALYLKGYIMEKGFSCFILRPDEYWKIEHLNPSMVIILGGPKAYEGIGEIVSGYLTEEEQKSLLAKGSMGVFYKDDVVIIAGNTRAETRKAAELYIPKVLARLWKAPKPKVIYVIIGYNGRTPVGKLPENGP